jgi:UDP-4-amino-4,6-dideoxy-N-acetyl-beta-L-altrosamine transaminase
MGLDTTLIKSIQKAKIFFTLDDGVDFVLKSFERMQGGEIFLQKVSSRKLTELTLSLPQKIQYEILDNSSHQDSGKKDLTTIDTTIEFDDHYVVKPVLASRNINFMKNSIGEEGKRVKTFIPYGKQLIEQDDINSVVNVLKSDFLTTGPKVKEFEDRLSEYCGAKYCVAVSNGTAALHLASLVLLNKNDKVLTTPNSFLATSNSVLYVGAKPIFIDIAEDGNIDLDLCEEYLRKDSTIKAIYGVAFSGNMLNQEKLKYLRNLYNVIILEDCAHAIGAKYGDINAGSCVNSDCSIFSFHPVKHLTTAEGGAITTNSEEIYEQLLHLRGHGMYKTLDMKPWEYEMRDLGFNYRITDLQCALGITQLKKLNIFLERRFKIVKKYDIVFKNSIIKPLYFFDGKSSYHLYVVQVDFSKLNISKEELFMKMREKSIGLQLHYIPINKQPYYKSLGYGDEKTPTMDKYYNECFSLPMFPKLSDSEQDYVIESLFEVLNG